VEEIEMKRVTLEVATRDAVDLRFRIHVEFTVRAA
jgi:hypothetical protein